MISPLDVVHEFLPKTEDSIIQIGRSGIQLFPSSGKNSQFHRRASLALISANTVSAGIVYLVRAIRRRDVDNTPK
jgi:hypothetical protein